MRAGEVSVQAKRTMVGAILAVAACWLALACSSSGGGTSCFSPVHGPDGTSCAGFDVGLSCPVNLVPWYTCVCTQGAGTAQTWVCSSAGGGGGGPGTGGGGVGGGPGTGGSGSGGSNAGTGGGSGDAGSD